MVKTACDYAILLDMAKSKKSKPTKSRSPDWQIGQPLMFPASKNQDGIERLAREAVEEGMRGPFKSKLKKSKKK
jgi:hypothetical protein